MKKVIAVIALVAFIVALPTSLFLMAKKGDKTFVCHITGENDDGTRYVGHVIQVSNNTVKDHCAHGDHAPATWNQVIGNDCSRNVNNINAVNNLCN